MVLLVLVLGLGASLVLTRHPMLRLIMLAALSVLVGVLVVRAFGVGELLVGIAMVGRGLVPDEPPRTPAAVRRRAVTRRPT